MSKMQKGLEIYFTVTFCSMNSTVSPEISFFLFLNSVSPFTKTSPSVINKLALPPLSAQPKSFNNLFNSINSFCSNSNSIISKFVASNIEQMRYLNLKNIIFFLLLTIIVLAFIPFKKIEPITYIERTTGMAKIEKVPGEGWLYWLYYNPIGQLSLNTMVKNKFLSTWYGNQMDKPTSKEKISGFVKDFNMDLSGVKKKDFESFNDFFYRKLKEEARPINLDSSVLVSPADGKVLAYSSISNQDFIVKGYKFNVYEYFQNDEIAKKYENGSLMIFRLCPTDYHRYHFPIGGVVIDESKIEGDYYSVSPIALKKKIELITANKRAFTVIRTKDFGDVVMSEVGATMVGSMITTYSHPQVEKGQEKGYFKFGGSTVILFFEEGKIEIDQDLLVNSQKQLETSVLMGESVGQVKR